MTFEEYEKREWIILSAEPDAKCTKDDVVSFDVQEGRVNIRCKRYGDGQFEQPKEGEQEGTIKGDGYVISMTMDDVTKRRQITFTPTLSIAGSWTAEEYIPGSEPEPDGE